jgi:HEAT repeat protein
MTVTFRRIVLTILSSLPLGTVSFAAHSALQDTKDQEAVGSLKEQLSLQRKLVFETGSMGSSIAESYGRFLSSRGLADSSDTEEQFLALIEAMEDKGMLQQQGQFLMAMTPSQH